jgi:hypothetical protein
MNKEYLTRIVQTFVLPNRRDRFLSFMESTRRYNDFLDNLLHDPRYLDPRTIEHLSGAEKSATVVATKLRRLGARSDAYLVGHCGELEDGTRAPLNDLLEACVGSMTDCMVYCADANVAYYEGHEGFGYLLRATPN